MTDFDKVHCEKGVELNPGRMSLGSKTKQILNYFADKIQLYFLEGQEMYGDVEFGNTVKQDKIAKLRDNPTLWEILSK